MKKESGITLVSLVVTIIILIILAGISINTLVGDTGIITKAQQAKENTLLAQEEEAKQLNQLYSQLNYIGGNAGDIDGDAVDKLLNFKKVIATAISNEGVATQETDSAEIMANNIGKIVQERTKDATATADNISEGKTAWVNGQEITGNGKDVNNAESSAKWQIVSQYTSVVQATSEITISPVMINEHFSTVSNGKMTITKSGNYKFSMVGTTYNIATTLTIKIYINNSLTKTFSSKEWISNGTRGVYTDLSLKEGDIVEIKGGVSNLSDGGGLFSGILFFE
ncbi:MAG: hypothetical protein ACLTEH_06755 [Clostridia bacterium]